MQNDHTAGLPQAKSAYAEKQNSVTYPLEIPLGMLRTIESAALRENRPTGDYLLSCVEVDLERFLEEQRLEKAREIEAEVLKVLAQRGKKLVLVEEDVAK